MLVLTNLLVISCFLQFYFSFFTALSPPLVRLPVWKGKQQHLQRKQLSIGWLLVLQTRAQLEAAVCVCILHTSVILNVGQCRRKLPCLGTKAQSQPSSHLPQSSGLIMQPRSRSSWFLDTPYPTFPKSHLAGAPVHALFPAPRWCSFKQTHRQTLISLPTASSRDLRDTQAT